jgi:hypothetical protein
MKLDLRKITRDKESHNICLGVGLYVEELQPGARVHLQK